MAPAALLGLAELSLEAGRPRDAEERLNRFLRQVPDGSLLQRAAALELLVRVQALLGEHARARQTLESIRSFSDAANTPPLRAATSFGAGALAVANQNYDEAMASFEDALDMYERSGAPYESARARLELASVLVMLGRLERAKAETMLAHQTLDQLHSLFSGGRAAALLQDIGRRIREAEASGEGSAQLTDRQLESCQQRKRWLNKIVVWGWWRSH